MEASGLSLISGSKFRVWDSGFRVWGLGFRVQGFWFGVWGCWVWGFRGGFRGLGVQHWIWEGGGGGGFRE